MNSEPAAKATSRSYEKHSKVLNFQFCDGTAAHRLLTISVDLEIHDTVVSGAFDTSSG